MARRNDIKVRPVSICACADHAFVVLTRGYVALLDREDAAKVAAWNWRAEVFPRTAYAVRSYRDGPGPQKFMRMHRLFLSVEPPRTIDHINGIGLDNRRRNLRACTHQENMRNMRGNRNASSRYKGVSWHSQHSRWAANIRIDGRMKFLGLFANEQDAWLAYHAAAKQHYGAFAWGSQ